MRSLCRFAIFLAFTYLLANSLLFAIWTLYYENISEWWYEMYPKYFGGVPPVLWWKYCLDVLTQHNTFNPFPVKPFARPNGLGLALTIIYDTAIMIYPVRLFWQKKTVFHAWLVAMAGSFFPPYIFLFPGLEQVHT